MNMTKVVVKIEKDFTVVPNEIIRNKEMSCNAKMVLITMLSLPPEWDFSVNGLTSILKEGRDSVRKALLEIEKFGYITRNRERFSDGTLGIMIYTVYQYPVDESERTFENKGFQPKTEKPTLDKSTQYNKDNKKEKKSINRSKTVVTDFDDEILEKAKEYTDNETILDGINYFLKTFKQRMNKSHPNITYRSLDNVIGNIEALLINVDDIEDFENSNGFRLIVDNYFDTEYTEDVDYKIQHFASGKVLEYQARTCGYITGWRD